MPDIVLFSNIRENSENVRIDLTLIVQHLPNVNET